jgi:ABC-type Fe3+ transport system permease subunit
MSQVLSVLVVGCILVGGFVGTKVGQARWSHRYYRRNKASMPTLRRAAWAEIRYAATATLVVALLVVAFLYGINARGSGR